MNAKGNAERISPFVQKLFSSQEYSDFTLTCEGRLYRLHKAIVCPQSDVFAAMLRSKFKEGLENSIHLPEEDAGVVHCMIRYLYCFDYEVKDQIDESGFEPLVLAREEPVPEEPVYEEPAPEKPVPEEPIPEEPVYEEPVYEEPVPEEPVPEEPPVADAVEHIAPMHALLLHTRMYIIAETYAIQGLKAVALRNFDSATRHDWDPYAFVQAADLAYTWTREGDIELRESVVRGLKEKKVVLTDDRWKPTLQRIGCLMYDVVRSMLQDEVKADAFF
ncbi:btb poz domain protein [Ophiostoma piceae UAMH 11346]|uniref:Btb poz domain protein n=1 Tax=Ophiostoma piceae (strain UAMH 11346) TaxID=1262450 RepID=S3D629_OPHP1|nr:btb poz domain protein [Ophiostoma piceae UAMH 11346]